MAKSHLHVITLSTLILSFMTILAIMSPACYADDQPELDGQDAMGVVSKDTVCVCGTDCGYPCMYYSPPPPSLIQPPVEMPPAAPEVPSPELYLPPPPPSWPWPTPPYPWYIPPPPGRGQVYAAQGGFEFYKPSVAWHRGVSWAQVLVSGVILLLNLL